MKIRAVGAELLHVERGTDGRTDGRTDITKLIVTNPDFTNAPKNCCIQLHYNCY